MEVDEAGWRWVHGLVIPKYNIKTWIKVMKKSFDKVRAFKFTKVMKGSSDL